MPGVTIQNIEVIAYATRRRGMTLCILLYVKPPNQFYQLVAIKNYGIAERVGNYLVGARDVRNIGHSETISGRIYVLGMLPSAQFADYKRKFRGELGPETQQNLLEKITLQLSSDIMCLEFVHSGEDQTEFLTPTEPEAYDADTLLRYISLIEV